METTLDTTGYPRIYSDTVRMIMVLSEITEAALDDAATGLSVDYETVSPLGRIYVPRQPPHSPSRRGRPGRWHHRARHL